MTRFATIATTTTTSSSWCTACRAETAFEQPGCLDGHGLDCPEWACVLCGEAIVVGFGLPEPVARLDLTSHVA